MTPESMILQFDPDNIRTSHLQDGGAAQRKVLFFPQEKITFLPQPAVTKKPLADPLTPTIFHEPWWLDIVTGGNYDSVEVRDNGATVGRLPYFLRRCWGMAYSTMPAMTHFLGPAVIEGEGAPSTRFLRRAQITRELIRQLPKASLYRYKCHRDITDTIAFQQEKFITAVQFTHEIAPSAPDELWKNLRGEKRKKIRQAQHMLTVSDIHDPQEFWRFYDNNLRKRNISNICDEQLCCKLMEACLTRKQGRIYAVRDKNNNLVAATFCIWDETSSFYFMSSRAATAHNGAASLLAWEAIKDASARGLIFDLDGISSATGVLFLTEFGGTVSPRYIVTRQTLLGELAVAVRHSTNAGRYFY